ncbi:MAG: response regulator transcription factor [Polyangiaceae bacterium]
MCALRALVVDDDRGERATLERTLSAAGYRTEVAVDARAGLAAIEKSMPDVIVVDGVMPGMSGNEMVRRVRNADNAKYPFIVMVSERSTGADIAAAFTAGVDDFVRKPVMGEELIARVNGVKRLRKLAIKLSERSSVLDWSDGTNLTKLQAWTQLDASIADDLASMFGQSLHVVSDGSGLSGATFGAEIPMSLAAENLEVRICVAFREESLRHAASILMGDGFPEEALRDIVREIANISGGMFKRLAQNDGVVLTTGLPVDVDPRAFGAKNPQAVRKWQAVFDGETPTTIAFQIEIRSRANDLVVVSALREGMVLARDLLGPSGALLLPAGTRLTSASIGRVVQLLGARHQVEVADAAKTIDAELRCA